MAQREGLATAHLALDAVHCLATGGSGATHPVTVARVTGSVLVWINGPFGVGKTRTAHELARRADGVVCDPEEVGFGLHRMMPRSMRGDFQDLPAWRSGVVEVLHEVLQRTSRPVVAPMTVVNAQYFDETVGRLRSMGHQVCHVTLLARRETVQRRLRERPYGAAVAALLGERALRHESFALAALDRCLADLAHPRFALHVQTDGVALPAVVDTVATHAGLSLQPDRGPRLVAAVRATVLGIRHVRKL